MVELSADMVAGLAALTAAIDDPEVDVAESIDRLSATVLGAVPSYLGLALLIEAHGREITVVAMDPHAIDGTIATSLTVPLARAAQSGDITLVLYGAVAGAFVDLAADMGYLVADESGFALDTHLSAPVASITGLAELSMVNQAVGVLVAGGYEVEQALRMLDVLAAADAGVRHLAAARLLAELDAELRGE